MSIDKTSFIEKINFQRHTEVICIDDNVNVHNITRTILMKHKFDRSPFFDNLYEAYRYLRHKLTDSKIRVIITDLSFSKPTVNPRLPRRGYKVDAWSP